MKSPKINFKQRSNNNFKQDDNFAKLLRFLHRTFKHDSMDQRWIEFIFLDLQDSQNCVLFKKFDINIPAS